jgi:hypothetical protein
MRRRLVNQAEENEKETEELDFTKPSYSFQPNGHHSYRQVGPYLVCKSCEMQHTTWIGIDKILVGFNEKDQPIIKKKKEVMRV